MDETMITHHLYEMGLNSFYPTLQPLSILFDLVQGSLDL